MPDTANPIKLTQPQAEMLARLAKHRWTWVCVGYRPNSDRTLAALVKRGLVVLHTEGCVLTGHDVTPAGRAYLAALPAEPVRTPTLELQGAFDPLTGTAGVR
jgi:hypothetical protein